MLENLQCFGLKPALSIQPYTPTPIHFSFGASQEYLPMEMSVHVCVVCEERSVERTYLQLAIRMKQ